MLFSVVSCGVGETVLLGDFVSHRAFGESRSNLDGSPIADVYPPVLNAECRLVWPDLREPFAENTFEIT